MTFLKNAPFRTVSYILCLWVSIGPQTDTQAVSPRSAYVSYQLIKPIALSYVVAAPVKAVACVVSNVVYKKPLAPRWDQIDGCAVGLLVSPIAMLFGLMCNGTLKRIYEEADKQYTTHNIQQNRKNSC